MKKNYLFLILLLFGVMSCSESSNNDEDLIGGGVGKYSITLSENEFLSIAFDGMDTALSADDTRQILEDFLATDITRSGQGVSLTKDKEFTAKISPVVSVTRSNSDKDVVFHKYSISAQTRNDDSSEDGYAIVCADVRYPNVIAYAETGSLEEAEAIENESLSMLARAERVALRRISQIKYYQEAFREETIEKIKSTLNIDDDFTLDEVIGEIFVEQNSTVSRSFSSTPSGTVLINVGPLTSTKWNQNSPYNLYMDLSGDYADYFGSSYNSRFPTGCTITCMAQLLAYIQPTIGTLNVTGPDNTSYSGTFSWTTALASSSLSSSDKTSTQAKQVAALMKTLAVGCGTTYGANGGSTSMSNARSFLKSKWSVTMDNSNDLTFANIKSSLDNLRLVVLTGTAYSTSRATNYAGSHAWLADGYKVTTKTTRQILQTYNVYCRCNFGWGGSYDGYYLFETDGTITFEVNGYEILGFWDSFNTNLLCYANAKK